MLKPAKRLYYLYDNDGTEGGTEIFEKESKLKAAIREGSWPYTGYALYELKYVKELKCSPQYVPNLDETLI